MDTGLRQEMSQVLQKMPGFVATAEKTGQAAVFALQLFG